MASNPLLRQWLNQPEGLATRLAEMQDDAGLTGKALAEMIGYSASNVTRTRAGEQVPSEETIRRWCWACRADDQADELAALARQATQRHIPWRSRVAVGMGDVQAAYTELHRQSTSVWAWGGMWIPGPLQTRRYAEAILTVFSKAAGVPGDVAEAVEARLERAGYVGDGEHTYRFAVSEAAVLSGPADDRALLEQIAVLDAMARGVPGVELWIQPLKGKQTVAALELFSIYTVAGTAFVIAEGATGETEWTDPAVVAEYVDLFWRVCADSVTGPEASDLLARCRRTVEDRI